MNWTSSFLLQSDNLAIVPHLPLPPVRTVGKSADHECGPEEVSRCSPQNRRSKLCSVDGRTGVDT